MEPSVLRECAKLSENMPDEPLRSVPELSVLKIERGRGVRRGGSRRLIPLILLLAIAGAAAFLWLEPRSRNAVRSAAPAFAVPVIERTTAARVTEGQRLTVLSATGYVDAETRADVSPKITSRITELNVTEGSRVKKGEVLARLDHTDLDAQLADNQADWENARIDLERQRRLVAQGVSAKAALDAAIAVEGTRRARVNYVKALLDYTVLRAPFDGVVVAKRAHVGEAVSPYGAPGQGSTGVAIVTLVDFSSLYVGADVSEGNLSRLAKEQPAEIVLEAYPAHVYHGALRQIIPSADRQKGTVKVKVGILDPDDRILPDLSAKVSFTSESTQGRPPKSVVEVARSAVVTRDGQTGVWVLSGDVVAFRPVRVGAESTTGVEIVEGLAGGESLASPPAGVALADGARVKIRQ